jgi:hypothetical protein
MSTMDESKLISQKVLEELIDEAIRPNAAQIARLWSYGEVALVFYEIVPAYHDVARSLGWTGQRVEVHRLSEKRAAKLADLLHKRAPTDLAGPWLRSRKAGRIFFVGAPRHPVPELRWESVQHRAGYPRSAPDVVAELRNGSDGPASTPGRRLGPTLSCGPGL